MDPDDLAFAECWERIEEVCSLLDGEGESIDVRPNDVLEVISGLYAMGRDKPGIFPTPDGCVQLEWDDGFEVVVRER